ncbi:MAG: hypothetical protein WC352_01965 [Candidatus Omnitrophota bacterium]
MNTPLSAPAAVKTGPKPYKRSIRNIMIHKPLQREYLFVIIGLFMVSTLFVGFVIHNTIREAAFGGGFHFGKISPYQILSEVSYSLVTRISLILFGTLIILALFGMSFLHRVAGPVYRFRSVLRRMNHGELVHPIQLREGDFFTEAADEINHLIRRLEAVKQLKQSLQDRLDSIQHCQSPESAAQLAREMRDLIAAETASEQLKP